MAVGNKNITSKVEVHMKVHNFFISILPPKFLSLCLMLQYFPVRPGENETAVDAV